MLRFTINLRPLALFLIGAALSLLTLLMIMALQVVRDPAPAAVHETTEDVSIAFAARRTHSLFPGDCLELVWAVDGAVAVWINEAAVPVGAGDRLHCDGTPPAIRVELAGGRIWETELPRTALFGTPAGLMLLAAVLGAGLSGLALLGAFDAAHLDRFERRFRRPEIACALAFSVAVSWVFALDQFTNSLNIHRYVWDHYHYIDMAENGLSGNLGLVAPYAYRPLTPLLAGGLADVTGRSVIAGFRIIAYAGAVAQLVLAFVLARQFTRKTWAALVVMLVTGLSTFNVKFLLFDIYRPDHLAFPLILIGMMGLLRRQYLIVVIAAALGVLAREFALLPAALLGFRLLRQFAARRDWRALLGAVGAAAVMAAAYLLPRRAIAVARSSQLIDVASGGLAGIFLNSARWFNLLLATAISLLPLLLVITPARGGRLWVRLAGLRAELALYCGLTLALGLVGGTDLPRFTVYLFAPLIIALAILLDEGVHPLEIGYLLLATAAFNRILLPVPMESHEAYLDFYIAFDDRIGPVTWMRSAELIVWVIGAAALRALLRRPRRQLAEDPAAGSTQPKAS
ncbi:MAG: hypothetical protein SNJ59_02590 [Aggregatilineales bacterium]